MTSGPMFLGYLIGKIPLAAFAGLRVLEIDPDRCLVSVPYGWRTQNPFRSTYFAALSMAAEMSTGALAMLAVREAPVSVAMIIVGLEASFEKKATGTTVFRCEHGAAIKDAVARAASSSDPIALEVPTVGMMADGTVVARFVFRWSFKRRS
jgi:hypothetical protein